MRRRMIRSAAIGAGLLGMLANSAEAASHCAKATEAAALRTRILQTELMVAALSCGQKDEYNTFVMHYRPQLKENGHALKSYFSRSYGSHGTQELNKFTTRLANEASKRSLSNIAKFCSDAKTTFTALQAMPSVQFATFVEERPTADEHGMNVCERSSVTVKKASLSEDRPAASERTKAHTTKTAKAQTVKAKSTTAKSATTKATKTASAKGATTTKKVAATKAAAKKNAATTTAELNKAQVAKTAAASTATQAKPTEQAKLTETAQSNANK